MSGARDRFSADVRRFIDERHSTLRCCVERLHLVNGLYSPQRWSERERLYYAVLPIEGEHVFFSQIEGYVDAPEGVTLRFHVGPTLRWERSIAELATRAAALRHFLSDLRAMASPPGDEGFLGHTRAQYWALLGELMGAQEVLVPVGAPWQLTTDPLRISMALDAFYLEGMPTLGRKTYGGEP